MRISYEFIRMNVSLSTPNTACRAAAFTVPPVYIPVMIPPIWAPSCSDLPNSQYPKATANDTETTPLNTTLSCNPAALPVNFHP